MAPDSLEDIFKPGGEVDAAALNSHQNDFRSVFIPFGDLVRYAINGAAYRCCVEEVSGVRHFYRGST